MKRFMLTILLAIASLGSLAMPVFADGIIIPRPPRPGLPEPPLRSLSIKYHRVYVTIQDQVATTRVDQVFINDSPYEIEGEYIFPLPEGASVSQFAMWVDGNRLEAQILPSEEARRIYEDIVRQKRDPALLEYIGHNAFRARIFPIPPHSEKRVELEYREVLKQDGGLVRYTYPLNTEKFSARPLEEVKVEVAITSTQPLKAIYSPSHEVDLQKESDRRASVHYIEENIKPDKDFVLYYTVSPEDLGLNLLSYKGGEGEDGFFLLLVAPKVEAEAQEVVARDVFLVLDTSGSMRGDKLEQAKEAALYVLDNLHEGDRFNLIAFSTATRHFQQGLRPISEVAEARRFVKELRAEGGTNIHRALEETLAQLDARRPQVILFLTDGLATEGEIRTEAILKKVADGADANTRLFAFGVGYDVNTFLLDTMAQDHHGTTVYVRPDENIERAVSSFYEKISTPVLADVALDFGGLRVEETFPYPLPDLFAGGQIVMVGRYREGGRATITLRGNVNQRPVQHTFAGIEFRPSGGADFIPRLWATRKIGYLLTQIRLNGSNKELIDEIIELSVRYGIVTPYTSFLVDETEDALTDGGRRVIVERELSAAPAAPASGRGGVGGGAAPTAQDAVSGQKVVEKSMAQNALRNADVATQPETEQVRTVGDKTFVLRQGVWTDTAFDPSKMKVEPVAFGSGRYFELLRQHAEWGRYLALGPDVILFWQGRAYRFGAEGQNEPVGAALDKTSTPAVGATPGAKGAANDSFWHRVQSWLQGASQ